jgi:hypothetical protein
LLKRHEIIQLLPQQVYQHNIHIPYIPGGASWVGGIEDIQQSQVLSISNLHAVYHDEISKFFFLVLP